MFLLKVGNVIGVSHDVCEKREKKIVPIEKGFELGEKEKIRYPP